MTADAEMERIFAEADERHRRRRRRTSWIYSALNRLFFPALLLAAFLVAVKFLIVIIPEFMG
jgi:hypothetical protein